MKNIYEQEYPELPVYSIEISRDPLSGKRRKIESPELSINCWSVFLQCTVYYLNEDGSKIESERLKPYQKRLSADNKPSGPWVDQLGNRVAIVNDEVPDNAILRYNFLIGILNSGNPIDIMAMVGQFVANADMSPYNEFDI